MRVWLRTVDYALFRESAIAHDSYLLHAGTRFRPLSLELPQPLFPIAGAPILQHHIEACAKVITGQTSFYR